MSFGLGFGFPRRRPGAVAWTPAQIQAGLWLDAADASTITRSGSSVTQWNDKSGNARNAVQTTAALQARFDSNAVNGNSSIYFSPAGTVTGYSIAVNDATARNWSIFAVVKNTYATYLGPQGLPQVSDSDTSRFGFQQYDVNSVGPALRGVVGTFAGTTNTTVFSITQNGTTFAAWANGSVAIAPAAATAIAIPANHTIGCRFSYTTNWFEGYLCEYLLLPNDPSTAVRQQLEGYLAWKWGVQASLPANHPYKNAPPTV